jgi:hypothetical protein
MTLFDDTARHFAVPFWFFDTVSHHHYLYSPLSLPSATATNCHCHCHCHLPLPLPQVAWLGEKLTELEEGIDRFEGGMDTGGGKKKGKSTCQNQQQKKKNTSGVCLPRPGAAGTGAGAANLVPL